MNGDMTTQEKSTIFKNFLKHLATHFLTRCTQGHMAEQKYQKLSLRLPARSTVTS